MDPINSANMQGYEAAKALCTRVAEILEVDRSIIETLELGVRGDSIFSTHSTETSDYIVFPIRQLFQFINSQHQISQIDPDRVLEFCRQIPNEPKAIIEKAEQLEGEELRDQYTKACLIYNLQLPIHAIEGVIAHEIGHIREPRHWTEKVHFFIENHFFCLILGAGFLDVIIIGTAFLACLTALAISLLSTVVFLQYQQHREWAADQFAAKDPMLRDGLRDWLKIHYYKDKLSNRISEINLHDPDDIFSRTDKWVKNFLSTHPSYEDRIRYLNSMQA